MTEIWLIRHGETEWNRLGLTQGGGSDIPLNDPGRRQAAQTAAALTRWRWDSVWASPLSRALETAQIICRVTGLDPEKIIPEWELRERGYGEAEGLSLPERKLRFPDNDRIPGAEQWEEVSDRAMQVLREIARQHPDERVLVIAHGGVINSVIRTLREDDTPYKPLPLKNAGVTVVYAEPQGEPEQVTFQTGSRNLDAHDLVYK